MKEILKELGFEHLPMLSEFWVKWEDRQLNDFNCIVRMNEYVELITQPLTKGMFIPCDEKGNVMRVPNGFSDNEINAGQL